MKKFAADAATVFNRAVQVNVLYVNYGSQKHHNIYVGHLKCLLEAFKSWLARFEEIEVNRNDYLITQT